MPEVTFFRECGDGYRRADCGSISPFAVKTAAYTILLTDAGKVFSNRGAGASMTLTLPAATSGFFVRLFKPTNQNVVFTATGGAKINGGSANGSVTLSVAVGLWLVASDGTDWMLTQEASATLAGLEHGTDGQLIVGQTGSAPLYKSITGDVTFSAAGASAIGAGKVLSAMMDDALIRQAAVAISAADIVATGAGKFGHANGYELLPAPAAGDVHELISAVLIYDFGVAAYTGGGNITVNWVGGAAITGLVSAANSVGAAGDKVVQLLPLAAAGNAMVVASAINLVTSGAFTDPGTAVGVIRVKVTYRVHTTALA